METKYILLFLTIDSLESKKVICLLEFVFTFLILKIYFINYRKPINELLLVVVTRSRILKFKNLENIKEYLGLINHSFSDFLFLVFRVNSSWISLISWLHSLNVVGSLLSNQVLQCESALTSLALHEQKVSILRWVWLLK